MQLNRFTAVCFDFDGTLADSFPAITASVNHVRALRRLPPLSQADVTRFVGHGPHYLLEHTVPGFDIPESIALYRAHHPSVMYEKTQLLPGASDVVAALGRAGKRIGLCSNKPRIFSEKLLAHLGLLGFFAAVFGPEDVAHIKPAPDMVVAAMRRLGATPAETLYVGDMIVDVQAGQAAGATVWVVAGGPQERGVLEAAGAERVLNNLSEILQ